MSAAVYDPLGDDDFADALDPTLQSIIDKKSLKWIFVGGKGGVGKTTTSCSIGALLAKTRKSVLVLSTDPAHNLSDAFSQKFGPEPVLVNGYSNLYCMELDPMAQKVAMQEALAAADTDAAAAGQAAGAPTGGLSSIFGDLSSSIPGIDEAMSFAELMKSVNAMTFDCIVFDTAPTGHTLRLLSFPKTLESMFDKFLGLKDRFGGMLQTLMASMGGGEGAQASMGAKLKQTMDTVKQVNRQFKDASKTTFVCVCIPEFLSLYETERLVQELGKFEIDTHAVVVNQVIPESAGLATLRARQKMQRKYLDQIYDLYEDFNVVEMPMLHEEVRGAQSIDRFSQFLLNPYEDGDCAGEADETAAEHARLVDFLESRAEGRALLEEYRRDGGEGPPLAAE
jgi:arsenite-transporting ATPase